jgi:hypothetical protein
MDVRIDSLEATVIDTEGDALSDALLERIARRVLELIERKQRADLRSQQDCLIASPDSDDEERYG